MHSKLPSNDIVRFPNWLTLLILFFSTLALLATLMQWFDLPLPINPKSHPLTTFLANWLQSTAALFIFVGCLFYLIVMRDEGAAYLGLIFLGSGLYDFIHFFALTTSVGFPTFWFVSRLILGLGLIVAMLFGLKKGEVGVKSYRVIALYFLFFLALIYGAYAMIKVDLAPFEALLQYTSLGLFLLALPIAYQFYTRHRSNFAFAIFLSLIPNAITQLDAMCTANSHLFNSCALFHIIEILSFVIPAIGLMLDNANFYFIIQKAMEMRANFISRVSHELKTPVSNIIGYTECLIAGTEGPLSDHQKDVVEKIQGLSSKLSQLIGDLVDIQKIDKGQVSIEKTSFNLSKTCRECAENFAQKMEEKGLEFNWSIDPDITINGDPLRIYEVVSNLLSNALKYTDAGRVQFTLRKKGKTAEICLSDTGVGIAKEDLPQLFYPFTRWGDREGMGLGLSICKKLIDAHKGTISVESTKGKGTTFKVEL